MMRAVVAVVCLGSAGVIAIYTHYTSGSSAPVYTVPSRAPDPVPAPLPSASATTVRPIDPTDRTALARALQRELKRVGCYQGEITGTWTTSSRLAMRTFTEHVNATLPVDNPDPVLLSLVQGHRERACVAACPAGQAAAEGGACLPAAVSAKAGDAPTAAAAASTTAAMALAPPDRTEEAGPKRVAPEARTAAPGGIRQPASGQVNPAPPEGMARDAKPRRTAEPPPPRPPKIVRDVLKVLGFK
jgi:hypothetical protein